MPALRAQQSALNRAIIVCARVFGGLCLATLCVLLVLWWRRRQAAVRHQLSWETSGFDPEFGGDSDAFLVRCVFVPSGLLAAGSSLTLLLEV